MTSDRLAPHTARVPPPTKHQLALMIWLAVLPTLTVLNLVLGDWLRTLPTVPRSTAYAAAKLQRVRMTPASRGPATMPTVLIVKLSVFPAATRRVGSSRGTIAPRTGADRAKPTDCTATSPSSSGALSTCNNACRSRAPATDQTRYDEPR